MEKKIDDIINQPGGGRICAYKELRSVLPINQIREGVELLKKTPDIEYTMQSVNKGLEENYGKIMSKKFTKEEADNFASDLMIWFANEILECRESLEITKQ